MDNGAARRQLGFEARTPLDTGAAPHHSVVPGRESAATLATQ